jgi:hypothetical protein
MKIQVNKIYKFQDNVMVTLKVFKMILAGMASTGKGRFFYTWLSWTAGENLNGWRQ